MTGQKRSEMEEKEDEVKLIDWDSSRLSMPLPREEDCSAESTARADADILRLMWNTNRSGSS